MIFIKQITSYKYVVTLSQLRRKKDLFLRNIMEHFTVLLFDLDFFIVETLSLIGKLSHCDCGKLFLSMNVNALKLRRKGRIKIVTKILRNQ